MFIKQIFINFSLLFQVSVTVSSAVLSYQQTGALINTGTRDKTIYHTNNKSIKVSKKQHSKDNDNRLKSYGSGDDSVWSNAFNFKKNWGTQIDPRTGTLVAYTKVGSMISNLGHGPNIDLEVNYNSNSLTDPDGIGLGWSWNITHFNLSNNQLSTSQGKSFNLRKNRDGQWRPRYHKLKDIQISGSKATRFVITYANGLRETLDHEGYETRLEQQDGRWVKFSYLSGTHLLSSISDEQNNKIVLTRKKGFIIITSTDAEGKPFKVYLSRLNGQLSDISLPKEDGQLLPVIHMNYLGYLLSRVTYPTGLQKNITYNCTDAMKVPLQNHDRGLCVVVQTSVNPGMNQPGMITRYTYGDSNANEHNYLGFNSGLDVMQDSNSDVLFEAPASYTYKTTEDNGITRQIRTYNKYHLLIDAKIISDRTNHTLTAVHNFFCNTNERNGCTRSTFKDLPVTYSLPLKVVTSNWGDNSGSAATEITEQQYDSQGRLISATDPYGRVKNISYCPAEGDDNCPAEPPGWSLSTLVESVTNYPSHQMPGSSKLPKITQYNHYKKQVNINGKGYILVLTDKKTQSGSETSEVKQQYYDNPQDVFKYGLLKATTITGAVSPVATFNSVTKNYYYVLNADNTTKTVYNTVQLKSGQLRKSSSVTTSLFTNQIIKSVDAENKNITHYHYDHWGRIIQVDFAADTAFSNSKYYAYSISPGHIQLIITGSHGLSTKIIFDGVGRQLKTFTEAIADTGKVQPGRWIPVKSTDYDTYGRIMAEHSYHIDSEKHIQQLTTTFDYDTLGRVYKVHLPDQETQVKMYDDPDRCTVSFTYDGKNHYSPVSIVHGNILDKPVEQIILPASFVHDYSSAGYLCKISNKESAARVSHVSYDGFGRKISFVDPAGRKVITTYDDIGRVTNTTDPAGNQFHNVYDLYGEIIQKWVTPAKDNTQYLLASAQYNTAGELLWRAGEDGKKTSYTYTEDGQIATTVMPSEHVISWMYNVIGLPVSESVDGKETVHIYYDPATNLPAKKTDITGISRWIYSDDAKVQKLIHTGENGYPNYSFSRQYDQNRRMISTTDLEVNKISTHYDSLGRVDSVYYHENNGKNTLLKMSVYDGFSRVIKTNYGSGMQRTINYDEYGQTKSVTDMLADKLLSAWKYRYDKEGNIVTLIHNSGGSQQATLHYQYDLSNNLVAMHCSGSAGLSLCPRDTSFQGLGLSQAPIIISQNYSFNALNRMQQVQESLLNTDQQKTVSKTVNYSYGYQQAPLRIKQITTQWNNTAPVTTNFVYDATGNMTVDSESNKIDYNIFNQITHVFTSDGKHAHYFYDGGGREVRETTGAGDSRNLFYNGSTLLNEQVKSLRQDTHTISYLGVGKAIDGLLHEYYEQNYKGDVIGVLTKKEPNHYVLSQKNIYSPYGMVWHTIKPSSALPWYQQTFTGFNGEQTDPAIGWQFLGAGNRTYNPGQRYFVSEDPAGDGYAFGGNNPVMNSDPSGNTPKWLGAVFHVMSYAGTLGMAVFHKKWTNIIGTTLAAALAVTGIGLSLYFGGFSTPLFIAGTGLALGAGSLSIASAAVPTNRGLSIASAVIGEMATVVSLVMLGNTAVCGISSLLSKVNLSADTNLGISLESLTESLGAASAEGGGAETSFINGEEDAATSPDSSPAHSEEYSVSPEEPQHIPPSYFGRKWNIERILHENFSRFIKEDSNGEKFFSVCDIQDINNVWNTFIGVFSKYIKDHDIPSMLFMFSREVMVRRPLLLRIVISYIEMLELRSRIRGNEIILLPEGFFGSNVNDLISVSHSEITYCFYAFWYDKRDNSFGFMLRASSKLGMLWHSWSFYLDSVIFGTRSWNQIQGLKLFIFGRF